jgi:hypothetical protein
MNQSFYQDFRIPRAVALAGSDFGATGGSDEPVTHLRAATGTRICLLLAYCKALTATWKSQE